MRRVAPALPVLSACLALVMAAGSAQAAASPADVPAPPQLQSLPPTPVVSAASAASGPVRAATPRTHVVVIEDDDVRIEETRVRGQTQRIVVQSKVPGAKAYEIIVGPGAKDSSQDRGATGQRAWSLFEF